MTYRSGFVCFVGRPNVGKSTLTNALVGQKVVITSSKPQTTRTVVRGILHRENAELIAVDTPGIHRPRTLLGQRLNDAVTETWSQVDVIALCFPANEKIGPGDEFIATEVAKLTQVPKFAVITKTDLATPDQIAVQLSEVAALGSRLGLEWSQLVPVSATTGHQVELLTELLVELLPVGPQLYPDGEITDMPEEAIVAEMVREAALEDAREELPHSIAVLIDEMELRSGRPADKPLVDIYATIYVERDSQKGIVIGRKGAQLRKIGTQARHQIESFLGTPVFLQLHVAVAKDWQRNPKQLRKLGF